MKWARDGCEMRSIWRTHAANLSSRPMKWAAERSIHMPVPNEHTPRQRILKWFSLVLLLFILCASITLWLLLTTPPAWWHVSGTLAPDSADRAAALERGGSRALSEPRESENPWTISIAPQDANAWLAHRLKAWAENREIEAFTADGRDIPPPRLHFDQGRIRLGVEVEGRVVGLTATPIVEHGALFLRGPRFFIGRVELSRNQTASLAGFLSSRFGPTISAEHRAIIESVLTGTEPVLERIAFNLDDGRRVSLVHVEVERDRLLITCRTTPAGK